VSSVSWTRTNGDVSEVLTLVRIDDCPYPTCVGEFAIQVTTGPDDGDDFVGLYTIDGDELTTYGRYSWPVVDADDLTESRLQEIANDWATGSSFVTPMWHVHRASLNPLLRTSDK
jgi:hypothetical protein